MNDVVKVVEAAYDLTAPDETKWLEGVAGAIASELGFVDGVLGYLFQVEANGWVTPRAIFAPGALGDFAFDLLGIGQLGPELQATYARLHRTIGAALATEVPPEELREIPVLRDWRARTLLSRKLRDAVCITATDPTRQGCMLVAPTRLPVELGPRLAGRYRRVAAHIAAGLRLRCALARLPDQAHADAGEALVEPGGKIAHAVGPATTSSARARLQEAVRSRERARGNLRRTDPDEAVAIWRGLVAGRWTLVDRYERDGRRYLVAHKNDPDAPDPRVLTPRERQVVGFAALGLSNKAIAYELGISPSTVGVLLGRAAAKLGTSRDGLVKALG